MIAFFKVLYDSSKNLPRPSHQTLHPPPSKNQIPHTRVNPITPFPTNLQRVPYNFTALHAFGLDEDRISEDIVAAKYLDFLVGPVPTRIRAA